MHELEEQAMRRLNAQRQRRYRWLLANRDHLARIIAEMACWGVWDTPALERQLTLTEDALTGLVDDPATAATLRAEWTVRDAELIHTRDAAPAGFDCAVCRNGRYGLENILAELPEPIE